MSRAIMDALINHRTVEHEAILRTHPNGSERPLEYLVRVAPLTLGSEALLLVTMTDIADKKRRENLERTFYHDLMNTLSALTAYRCVAELDNVSQPENLKEMGHLIGRVVDEVRAHRALMNAEQKQLSVRLERMNARALVEELRLSFEQTELYRAHQLSVNCCDEWFQSDHILMLRVLTNMLKNAFEAAKPGELVQLTCERDEHHLIFCVQNPGKIAEDVTHRVFTRSFTTKGEPGRGIGTYSMKLLGERYLHGKVTFTSDDTYGTRFFLRVPIRIASDSERVLSSRTH
jgi:signal transduction histidine kinase